MIKKSIISQILYIVFSVCSFSVSSISLIFTNESRLFTISNNISNHYSRDNPPIIKSYLDHSSDYKEPFDYFYYSSDLDGFRCKSVSNPTVLFKEGVNFNPSIYKQPSYNIKNEFEWGFYLDYGLFATYFSDEYEADEGDEEYRGNLMISDKIADKLLLYYNLSSYEELLVHNYFSKSIIEINGLMFQLKISNIIYSEKRSSPRNVKLYGNDFALINFFDKNNDVIKYAFEFDLKPNFYSPYKIIKKINSYNCFSYYELFVFLDDDYTVNAQLTYMINNYKISQSLNIIIYFIFLFLLLCYISWTIFLLIKKQSLKIIIALLVLFSLTSFVDLLIFVPPIVGVFPCFGIVFGIISIFVFAKKERLCNEKS